MRRAPFWNGFVALAVALLAFGLFFAGCQTDKSSRSKTDSAEGETPRHGQFAKLPEKPNGTASSAFWDHWGDGKAELASYEGEVSRYGELRDARAVLIYVTEPHDRRDWVKDDEVEKPHRVDVLKLNRTLKFQTGIYPYAVMTSVFSPVDDWDRPRFQPTKITLNAQEWCGNVFLGLWPGPEMFFEQMHSYFDSEEDRTRKVETGEKTLYQDALPIQLRELDGPFNGGDDWEGELVPSAWHSRTGHEPLEPVDATIERSEATVDGTAVKRFVLEYGDVEITYDIESDAPHRLLRWEHSNGGHLRLQESTRLPYWKLNKRGDESYREELGLKAKFHGEGPPEAKAPGSPGGESDGGESDESDSGDETGNGDDGGEPEKRGDSDDE